MGRSDIHDNAKRCVQFFGDEAESIATESEKQWEAKGNESAAQNWRLIRQAIADIRTHHVNHP